MCVCVCMCMRACVWVSVSQADNEEMVVRRGLDWLKALKVRAADAGDLFQRLRLPLTSLEFIRKEVVIQQLLIIIITTQ